MVILHKLNQHKNPLNEKQIKARKGRRTAFTYQPNPFQTIQEVISFLSLGDTVMASSKLSLEGKTEYRQATDDCDMRPYMCNQSYMKSEYTHCLVLDIDRKEYLTNTATDHSELLTELSKFFHTVIWHASFTTHRFAHGRIVIPLARHVLKGDAKVLLEAFFKTEFATGNAIVPVIPNASYFMGLVDTPRYVRHEYLDATCFNKSQKLNIYSNTSFKDNSTFEVWNEGVLTTDFSHKIYTMLDIPKYLNYVKESKRIKDIPLLAPTQGAIDTVIESASNSAKRKGISVRHYVAKLGLSIHAATEEVIPSGTHLVMTIAEATDRYAGESRNFAFNDPNYRDDENKGYLHKGEFGEWYNHSGGASIMRIVDNLSDTMEFEVNALTGYMTDVASSKPVKFVQSPTGSGKTYSYLGKMNHIILTPTTALAKQIGENEDCQFVAKGETIPNVTTNMLVMTYAKFGATLITAGDRFKNCVIIVDEAPNIFQTSRNQYTLALNNLVKVLCHNTGKEFKQVIFVSANPKFYNHFKPLMLSDNYDVHVHNSELPPVHVSEKFPDLRDYRVSVVYLNNLRLSEQLKAFHRGSIDIILANSEHGYSVEELDAFLAYEGVEDSDKLPNRCVVFTSGMREGVSLHSKIDLSVAFGTGSLGNGVDNTIQALSRARNCTTFMAVRPMKVKQEKTRRLDYNGYFSLAKSLLGTKGEYADTQLKLAHKFNLLPNISNILIKSEVQSGSWAISKQIIAGIVIENRNDDEYYDYELFEYGMEEAGYRLLPCNGFLKPSSMFQAEPKPSGHTFEELKRQAKVSNHRPTLKKIARLESSDDFMFIDDAGKYSVIMGAEEHTIYYNGQKAYEQLQHFVTLTGVNSTRTVKSQLGKLFSARMIKEFDLGNNENVISVEGLVTTLRKLGIISNWCLGEGESLQLLRSGRQFKVSNKMSSQFPVDLPMEIDVKGKIIKYKANEKIPDALFYVTEPTIDDGVLRFVGVNKSKSGYPVGASIESSDPLEWFNKHYDADRMVVLPEEEELLCV